jgi:hypothetical protein
MYTNSYIFWQCDFSVVKQKVVYCAIPNSRTPCTVIVGCIGGVMVNMLVSSVVDSGFKPQSDQTKDYKMVCVAFPLSTQH